jgi:hypothetical protein
MLLNGRQIFLSLKLTALQDPKLRARRIAIAVQSAWTYHFPATTKKADPVEASASAGYNLPRAVLSYSCDKLIKKVLFP